MPIYEYLCRNCGNHFEELRKFSEKDRDIECPKCKSKNTQIAVSVFGTAGSGTSGPSSSGGGCKFG